MKKPSLFVSINSNNSSNPIEQVLKQIGGLTAEVVDQVVHGDVEADIALTNSVATALRITKETEQTTIVIVYFGKDERDQALAFAGRYPDRVTAVPYVGTHGDDEMEIVPFLLKLIIEKTKEEA